MPTDHHDPPTPNAHPAKRQRHSPVVPLGPPSPTNAPSSPGGDLQAETASHTSPRAGKPAATAAAAAGNSSNFRNVSACNRCRLRKNRCDQKLPSCNSCAKAGVPCVGYDPITKKQIPRSYVFYLETRVEQLESILLENKVSFPPADDLELCSRTGSGPLSGVSATETGVSESSEAGKQQADTGADHGHAQASRRGPKGRGVPNVAGSAKPRSLAAASGVSFARVVLAAVQYSVSDQTSNPDKPAGRGLPAGTGTSMRDSFFGLHTKPTISPAPFPDEELGRRLANMYFEISNPQIPILHRVEFMEIFGRTYSMKQADRSPRELYLLNMVFAIGSGAIIVDDGAKAEGQGAKQAEPEEYHASAIVHLDSCLSSSGGGLDVLQAVLLLANFGLLRPVPPGLW